MGRSILGVWLCMACLGWGVSAWGQHVRHANAFLQVGRNARHEALGRTLGAEAYSPMLGTVNPASLATLTYRHSAATSYSHQFGGMGLLWSGSYAHQLSAERGVEATLVYYGVQDIPNTLRWIGPDGRMDDRQITRFDVSDFAALLSYGQRVGSVEGLSVGGGVKLTYRHAGGFATGYGVGFEVGARYERGGWGAAAVLHDPTTSWTFWDIHHTRLNPSGADANLTPETSVTNELTLPSLSLYGSYRFDFSGGWQLGIATRVRTIFGERSSLMASLGPVGFDPSVGGWVRLPRVLEIRFGVRQFQLYETHRGERSLLLSPSGGLGLHFGGVELSYALTAPLATVALRLTHLVSLSFSFGAAAEEKLRVEGPAEPLLLDN